MKANGSEGKRRKEFPRIREGAAFAEPTAGKRLRLHRTRFFTNVGTVFPDQKCSVWPRPPTYAEASVGEPAPDHSAHRTAEDCSKGSKFEPQTSQLAQLYAALA